ncbi:hypothetical protein K7B10_37245 [Streptomyces flavotricini]|uniref:DUF4190 domain-containing protein n=1 Tax=Streptomyces flavotricini TaxID=66888 RepID=A0ABS8EHB4_9ACTN|nr:hypothetical protein [Streptomyces flavotricini]MCC0100328.1 hypothetical protein [Streptomyces flavotricini]
MIGLILGIAALMAAKRTGVGRGKAVTAVVTSSLAIVVSGLVAVFMVWCANKTQECYQPDGFRQYTQCVREHLNGTERVGLSSQWGDVRRGGSGKTLANPNFAPEVPCRKTARLASTFRPAPRPGSRSFWRP